MCLSNSIYPDKVLFLIDVFIAFLIMVCIDCLLVVGFLSEWCDYLYSPLMSD